MMLRRIADNLYWAARYLERAEWRARLAGVHYNLLIEGPRPSGSPWESLLAIFGDQATFAERGTPAEEQSVLAFFTFDTDNPASIRRCIDAARDNLRALRHRVSSELWLELNTLHLDARDWSPDLLRAGDVFDFFAQLQERFYRISGVIDGTLRRDLGFDFLDLGRMLERTESVARLLDIKYHLLLPRAEDVGGPIDLLQWAAVLRSASALEAYRLANGNAIQPDRVAQVLLFDEGFPLSARFSIARVQAALERIAQAGSLATDEGALSVPDHLPSATSLAGELASRTAGSVIGDGLHDFLLGVQDECDRINDAIFAAYLRFE